MKKIYSTHAHSTLFEQCAKARIVSLTMVDNMPIWTYKNHKHNDSCEIMFVLDGEGTYVIDSETYSVKKNDIIAINQDVFHSESSNNENPISLCTCTLSHVKLKELAENHLIPSGARPVFSAGEHANEIRKSIDIILKEHDNMHSHTDFFMQLELTKILGIIHKITNSPNFLTTNIPSNNHSLAKRIKAYLDTNYKNEISLEILSKVFFVSTYHIVHEMKKEVGVSPINYLIDIRMGEAQRMLLSTDMTVTQIANAVGYVNPSHFMNLFSKRIGIPPLKFREMSNIEKK